MADLNNPYMNYLMTQNPELARMLTGMYNQPGQPVPGPNIQPVPQPAPQPAPASYNQQLFTREQVNEIVDQRMREVEQQKSYQVLMGIINTIIPKELQEIIVANPQQAMSMLRSSDLNDLHGLFTETWNRIYKGM